MADEKAQFNVALSYSESDVWAARDLHDLICQYGYSVYCADRQPDLTRGILRERLHDIYSSSRVNVMIWSTSYANKPKESIVAMEEQCLWLRHVKNDDAKSLFILSIDDTPIPEYLAGVLTHILHRIGIMGATKAILSRLKEFASYNTQFGIVCHPLGTESDRGQLRPCSFLIKSDYQSDPLGRWQQLADVEVEIVKENFPRNLHIYLIPSGGTTPLLGHSLILRTDPGLLERKRQASIRFAQERMGREQRGFWFHMRKRGVEIPTLYSAEYDAFLNSSMREP